MPDYIVGRDGEDLLLTNFENSIYRYHDPLGTLGNSQNFLREAGMKLNTEKGFYTEKEEEGILWL